MREYDWSTILLHLATEVHVMTRPTRKEGQYLDPLQQIEEVVIGADSLGEFGERVGNPVPNLRRNWNHIVP